MFGVGIGVSAAIAMSLANEAVFHSFQKTVSSVTGNVTIQVSANEDMLDELVAKKIRKHPLVDSINPVINLSVKVINPKSDLHLLNIQAVDLLEWLGTDTLAFPSNNLKDLNLDYLISPDVLFLHQDAANRLNLKKGDSLNQMRLIYQNHEYLEIFFQKNSTH